MAIKGHDFKPFVLFAEKSEYKVPGWIALTHPFYLANITELQNSLAEDKALFM